MSMKRAALAAAVLAFIGGTALAEGVSLAVVNNSSKTIYHLYLSPANDNNWGPDQMGDTQDDTVAPGDSFTLTDIDPGKYDVKLATKSGTECEVDDVEFDADYKWSVTNAMLNNC